LRATLLLDIITHPSIMLSSSVASSSRSIAGRSVLLRASGTFAPRRYITSTRSVQKDGDDNPFIKPGPIPLPPKEQREFEQLVKDNANALQFKNAANEGDEMHPQYRARPKADFEGDVNPKTGEVGGPKKEPLTWERE
jgi:hypothetical protein